MTNKDYKILGKIISIISADYPPQMSNKFADKVMDKIYLHNASVPKKTSNNYLNLAASIFFAVITTYALVNYNSDVDNNSSIVLQEKENTDNNLIRRVIDKDPCENIDNTNSNEKENNNDKCK